MTIKRDGITYNDLIQEVGFDDKTLAGESYIYLCEILNQIPHGENERINVKLSGPEVDPETGDILYNVSMLVDRIYTSELLKILGE